MANTPTALVRTGFADTNGTLFTVSGTVVITSIVVCNTNSSSRTFTLELDGQELFDAVTIAGDTTVIAEIKQTMTNGTLIEGFASDADDVKVHISGMVIS
jgi:uncharacterized lipoprotein YehR (DUF1307 family)